MRLSIRSAAPLILAAALAACNRGAPPEPEAQFIPAHNIQQLMATVVQPQADIFWKSAGTVTDATGAHDLTPVDDAAWLRTRSAAATVTEMGNLLQTPLYARGRGDDWIQFSKALVEIGRKAEKAAVDRNSDAIFEVGGTMYNVCSACHQMYPPAATAPKVAQPAA